MDHSASKIMPSIEPLKLPANELAELHVRYAARKTKRVLDMLFRAHAPLAISLARRFSVHHNHVSDLQMAAFRGLLEALSRYDPKVGKFTTFAYWWILKFILKEREFDQNLVRIPLSLIRKHRRVRQLIEEGFSIKRVAQKLKLPVAAVETLYGLYDYPHCVSFEEENVPDVDYSAETADEDSLRDLKEQLFDEMQKLPPKWKMAATMRFQTSKNRTFVEIGRRMKCSPQMASRYYHCAIRFLKIKINRHG